jgi:hypothetical protein
MRNLLRVQHLDVLRQGADGQNIRAVRHVRISVEQPVVMLLMVFATGKHPHSYVMNWPHCFVATSSRKKRAPYGALAKVDFARR